MFPGVTHIFRHRGPRMLAVALLACLLCAGMAGAAGQTRTIRDEMGRQVTLPVRPQRVVPLIASLTETLYALGLGDKVVGATTWADYPPQAKKLPRVGSYAAPNLEKIVALGPDLVLATKVGNPSWVVDKLAGIGISVYVTTPDDPDQVPASLERIGQVCGAPEEGKRLKRQIQSQFDQVARRLKGATPRRTLLVIGSRPLVSVSQESLNHKLIVMAGGDNVAAQAPGPWPRLSLEWVVQSRPEVVVISTMDRGQDLERELDYWWAMPGVGDRPGVRVVSVNSDLMDRPGPRIGLGLISLAKAIHPERFQDFGPTGEPAK